MQELKLRMKYSIVFLFFLLGTAVHGQICSSGLGDPIVNIDFGAGPGFGPPLASGITNMHYMAQGCVLDNNYEIVNSSNNCFAGDWLSVNYDHTGDPDGYYMLIGASDQPSDFYVQTITGLCVSTTYQFAAWILNMASHTGEILPNITFSIEKTDGTVLQSIQTGDIPVTNPAKWNQYAFYFTSPPGISSVVLRITNNAPGGYGNDLALDDISFRSAGPSVNVTINGHSGDTVTMCSDPANNLQFLGTVENCYSSTAYQWQESMDNGKQWADIPGAVNAVYSAFPTTTGNYLYRLAAAQSGNIGNSSCQVVSAPDSIVVLKTTNPAIVIATDTDHVCVDSLAIFTAVSTDGGTSPLYQWMINGLPAGTSDPVYSSNVLSDGDLITCMMTSDAVCPANSIAASNTISMNVSPNVISSLNITSSANFICSDSMVTFTAFAFNAGSQPAYQWEINGQPAGADEPVFSSANLNDGDLVSAVMKSNLQCSAPLTHSNSVRMTVYQRPAVTLPPDTVIAGGSSVQLNPSANGQILTWQWTPATGLNDPAMPDPVASPVGNTTYHLLVMTADGCTASAKQTVSVFYDFLMPNVFTPNGDGRNDLFRIPPASPVRVFRFSVYDRWGALVFASSSNTGWDGRFGGMLQPAGTYVWMIEYYDPLIKKPVTKNGTVELIR